MCSSTSLSSYVKCSQMELTSPKTCQNHMLFNKSKKSLIGIRFVIADTNKAIKTYFYSSKRKAAKSFLKIPKGLFLVMVIPYVGSFMYLTALIWFISNISLYGIWLLQWLIQWILWILPDTLKMTSFHVFFY